MNRGEVPGYEFEVPRGPRHASGPRHELGHDPRRQLRRVEPEQAPRSEFGRDQLRQFRVEPEQPPKSSVRAASSGVLSVMRRRNWLMGLAVPIVAADRRWHRRRGDHRRRGQRRRRAVGARRRLPARPARRGELHRAAGTTRVTLTAIGAAGATEVAAGGVNGGPALWSSPDGGTTWTRAALAGPAAMTGAGTGQLAAVAHGNGRLAGRRHHARGARRPRSWPPRPTRARGP